MSDTSQDQHVEEMSDSEMLLDSFNSSSRSWSCNGDLQRRLERRWSLWHEFMKKHAHLEAWLRVAEKAVNPSYFANVSYTDAKEELRKLERLRQEASSRLVQLDALTQRNRNLTPLFQGVMRARLLSAMRDSGRRWDDIHFKLEAVAGRLQHFVSEWEEFEAQREELALWLADMNARLVEVDHLTESTCEKLKWLQSFQECVCVNSGRVNALLQRGEALLQRSSPADAHHVERHLLELLRRCSHVYNDIARTHTRLLSMRLVFEDDCILSQASDSGCPSEIPPDEEGLVEEQQKSKGLSKSSSFSPRRPPSSPSHEHLGLEWDPSVDVGRSVSREDADSSYFSACPGLGLRDGGLKRWSFFTSLDSQSNISDNNKEADELSAADWLDKSYCDDLTPLCMQRWTASTPDPEEDEPDCFDGQRIKAWLRVQSSAPSETGRSKAVQTDGEMEMLSHDPEGKSPDWLQRLDPPNLQAPAEFSCCRENKLLSQQSNAPPSSSCSFRFLFLLSALLAVVLWLLLQPSACHHSNRMTPSFHMMLRYINGPPPT